MERVWILLAYVTVLILTSTAGAAAQENTAAAPEKNAADALQNVQVLKDVPLSEWEDVMNGFEDALGVTCQHCHVGTAFEKDDLKAKRTARAMLRMMRDLNTSAFDGQNEVTCYTCHQGGVRPKTRPPLWTKTEVVAQVSPSPSASDALPDATQVLARYRKAVGTASVNSVRLKATMVPASGLAVDTEIEVFPPDKLFTQLNVGGMQVRQVSDGTRIWAVTPRGIIQLPPTQLVKSQLMRDTLLPVKFPSSEAPRKTVGLETIDGRVYTVLESQTARKLERLYFDKESGLLFRRYTEARSRVGLAPLEISFEDYRDTDGLKMPYLVTMRFGTGRTQYRISEIRTNVELDPERFTIPH